MATRYWVGGGSSTNWNATGNTNWSATSGGSNNASVPGASDDAIFDANSGSGTTIISASINLRSLDFQNFTGTVQHGNFTVSIFATSGFGLRMGSGMTYSPNGTSSIISLSNTSGSLAPVTAGKSLGNLTIAGLDNSCSVTLQEDLVALWLQCNGGVFNANGYNVTVGVASITGSGTRTVTMGSGTWTLNAVTSFIWDATTITNLTFNKNTANIVVSGTPTGDRILRLGSLTYNNITIGANTGSRTMTFTGSPTINKLSILTGQNLVFPNGGSFTCAELDLRGSASKAMHMQSTTVGTQSNINVASGTPTLTFLTMRDMNFGGGATFTATDSFNLGNNTGITINSPSGGGHVATRLQLGM